MAAIDTRIQIIGALKLHAKILPRYAPDFNDADVQKFWYGELKTYDFNSFERALKDLVSKSNSFPSLGQIKAALDGTENIEDRANAIATQIQGILLNYSGFSRANLCDVAGEVVRRHGGWAALGDLLEKDVPFKFKDWKATALVILRNPGWKEFHTGPLLGPAKNIVAGLLEEPCELKAEDSPESPREEIGYRRLGKTEREPTNRNLCAEFRERILTGQKAENKGDENDNTEIF
jgi:hypothetical protein